MGLGSNMWCSARHRPSADTLTDWPMSSIVVSSHLIYFKHSFAYVRFVLFWLAKFQGKTWILKNRINLILYHKVLQKTASAPAESAVVRKNENCDVIIMYWCNNSKGKGAVEKHTFIYSPATCNIYCAAKQRKSLDGSWTDLCWGSPFRDFAISG